MTYNGVVSPNPSAFSGCAWCFREVYIVVLVQCVQDSRFVRTTWWIFCWCTTLKLYVWTDRCICTELTDRHRKPYSRDFTRWFNQCGGRDCSCTVESLVQFVSVIACYIVIHPLSCYIVFDWLMTESCDIRYIILMVSFSFWHIWCERLFELVPWEPVYLNL